MSGARAPDFFCREAQRLGYVARSAFKVLSDPSIRLLMSSSPPPTVAADAEAVQIDLSRRLRSRSRLRSRRLTSGGLPELGSYTQGRRGCGYSSQVHKVKVPSQCDARVRTVCADVMTLLKGQAKAMSPQGKGFSVILSDMCPSVSGITTKDAALSCELGMRALSLTVGSAFISSSDVDTPETDTNNDGALQPGGNLVIKLLESEDIQDFSKFCKPRFTKAAWLRPKATRSSSREIYLICQGLR